MLLNWKSTRKALKTAIKQELNPHYALWGDLENKTNATSYPNIGSLKIVIQKEWNTMWRIYFESMPVV